MTDISRYLHMIVLPDNPPEWPAYDPQFVSELVWNPRRGHRVDVRRAFETIDRDRWYLVANVYGHPSMRNGYSGVERYETVHGIPRPRRGARGYFQLKEQGRKDRIWHHGMTWETSEEASEAIPIGEPVPISVEDAWRYWDRIRVRLRLTEEQMERKGMPKPRRHVVEGRPYWWSAAGAAGRGAPVTVQERVTSFRRIARSAR